MTPKRLILALLGIALFFIVLVFGAFYFLLATGRGLGGPTHVDAPPSPTTIPLAETVTTDGYTMPPGFSLATFAEGMDTPRFMTIGPDGALYVAEMGAGRVLRLPDADGDGTADSLQVVADGLYRPNSLAFAPDGSLYVGEVERVVRLRDPDGDGFFDVQQAVITGIPKEGHFTRTVLFSPDGAYLFLSVGSSCNVCEEKDARRATILRYNPDGSGEEIYARGLRNAVGITFRPGTDELWATNNGRDWLGDDLPPDTVQRVHQGDDFGWPRCHAGRIEDPDFGEPGSCQGVAVPEVELQAHSAPLGLAFYDGDLFPEAYRGDLFVAFHGSWNRQEPTGYKIVRIPFDENGPAGGAQDFVTGWLTATGEKRGRPVDVVVAPDGSLFISDDASGVVYRLTYTAP
ncbi:MAG: sorbosone dehydrogenase family protein [Anaerolineae bacterium]|nr:MAG: sorbosone dehydrogenase family protein [Anaerolineae bacterium]